MCFICFLCLVCRLRIGKSKDVRHKNDGDERLPPPAFTPSTAAAVPLPRGGRSGGIRVLSKLFIQLRVQGRNPARFKGGYGVPRGFKGEKFEISPKSPRPSGARLLLPPPAGGPAPSRKEVWGFTLPLKASYTTPGAGHMKKISAQHPSPPLRRINQPFQRVDAAYALVIGGRVVVKRQNQFGV